MQNETEAAGAESNHAEPQYSHVSEKIRPLLQGSDADRLAYLDQPRWIKYERADKLIDMMAGLLTRPTRTRMPNLLIVGEPNNGKSTLVERFESIYGKVNTDDIDADPEKAVIVAQAPPTADEAALYIEILKKFWVPFSENSKRPVLRAQVVHQCRQCKVRMLIIDEIHSVLVGTPNKQREVMNALKYLCNELRIPMVGVGTTDAVRVLHTDPQHSSRFDVVPLPLWELNQDFQKFLASFERLLPLKKPSGLHLLPLVQDLHTISSGNLGDLERLVVECAKKAIRSGSEQITPEIVKSLGWIRPTKPYREVVL